LCQAVGFDRVIGMVKLKIKEVAVSKGISMSRLSRIADVSYNTLLTIYHNPHHDVSIYILERIAKALQVSICDLLDEKSEE